MTTASKLPDARVQSIRRIAIIVVIVSLSASALIGIVTLLTGEFGEAQGRTMMTTLVIGIFGVLSLCDLAVAGKRYQWAGLVGILASAVALAVSLYLIWAEYDPDAADLWKVLAIASITAISFAHANLLLLLADRRRTAVRVGLWVTIGLIAVLAVLLALLVLTDGDIGSDGYTRLVGTVAILDVLGTIVVPVIGAILREGKAVQGGEPKASGPLLLTLPPELDERLTAAALSAGTSRAELAVDAIRRQLSQ